jgi:phosphopantothenate synthetase
MYYNAKSRVGVLADLQYPFMCLQNFFLFGDKSDTSAISAINATDTPVMIVGGNSDEVVPDAISMLHKADKITNPNAVTLKIEEAYRGEHSTAWLSRDAAEYVVTTKNPTDKTRANKLDEGFMKTVMEFFEKAVQ